MAVCIAGQYRTHAYTMRSLERRVLYPLQQRFDVVDVFYALDMNYTAPLLENRGERRVDLNGGHRFQFGRFEMCRELMETTTTQYAWAIRTRPDILFTEDLRLEGLSDDFVHAKLRCANRDDYPSMHLHEISQELQDDAVLCPLRGCPLLSTRLDDQFAVVPAKYIRAYFLVHHERAWQTNITLEDKAYPSKGTSSTYRLTRSLVDQGVEFRPLRLGFCLQRSETPCRVKGDRAISCNPR